MEDFNTNFKDADVSCQEILKKLTTLNNYTEDVTTKIDNILEVMNANYDESDNNSSKLDTIIGQYRLEIEQISTDYDNAVKDFNKKK